MFLLPLDAGGPLAAGDIEVRNCYEHLQSFGARIIENAPSLSCKDVAGRTCVACPWHRHQITLDTGESLYTSVDPANPKKKKPGCSKGVKQRTHFVKVERGFVYIQLSDLAHKVDSDVYFSAQFKEMREATLKEPILQVRPPKMKVPIHSYRPPPRS